MANVTLVRPSFTEHIYGAVYKNVPEEREVRPPLGLAYLASALIAKGHNVSIVDGEPEMLKLKATVDRVMATKPDYVGVTSTTPEFPFATQILRAVKAVDPRIITMAGGSHVTALAQYTIDRHPEIDYVVVAEGEKGVVRVVDERPRDRVIIASDSAEDGIDPNTNLWPARHLLDYERNYKYADPVRGIVRSDAIEGQRSCPFHCSFCFRGVGDELRYRDAKQTIDELEHTYRTNGVQHAIWFDDTLTAKKSRAHEMCDEILRRGIDMSFYCFTASNCVDKELLAHMRQAGFTMTTFGIESGSQPMLSAIGKAAKLWHYEKAYEAMVELGIETRGSVILGHPYENHGTIWKTIDFVCDSLQLQRLGVNVLMPFPGTKVWFQVLKQDGIKFAEGTDGLDGVNDDWSSYRRWGNAVIETKGLTTGGGLSRDDLLFYHKFLLMKFYTTDRVVNHSADQRAKGNTSEYFHRPITEAQKQLAAFNRNIGDRVGFGPDHVFSNGMSLKEVMEDVSGNPMKYDVTGVLAESKKKGIVDATPRRARRSPDAISSVVSAFKPLKMATSLEDLAGGNGNGNGKHASDLRPLQMVHSSEDTDEQGCCSK